MRQRGSTARGRFAERIIEIVDGRWSARALKGLRRRQPVRRDRFAQLRSAELIVVPQDLRPRDASFWFEVECGSFGLAGINVDLLGRSPFAVADVRSEWQRELLAFGWLRHLEAAQSPAAATRARQLVLEWIALEKAGQLPASALASRKGVRARRILSLLTHAPFLLDEASSQDFDEISWAIARDVDTLAFAQKGSGGGYDQLLVATALVAASLALKEGERDLEPSLERLAGEISRQFHPDGGHVSRSASVVIECLLDWLPLASCFQTRHREQPAFLSQAIGVMLDLIAVVKLGDHSLARFNGAGCDEAATLATLAAYYDKASPQSVIAVESGYARLVAGASVMVVDVGAAPPLDFSCEAHAGCLSFEWCVGSQPLFVNCGSPIDQRWQAVARATSSHSTVCVGETSSGELVPAASGILTEGVASARLALRRPTQVTSNLDRVDQGVRLVATHDGYLARHRLYHTRELVLSDDGSSLCGVDRIEARDGDRLRRDVPFALHFHVHPACEMTLERRGGAEECVAVRMPDGSLCHFTAPGQAISVEDSLFFGRSSAPIASHQIVVRGACAGLSVVAWQVTCSTHISHLHNGTARQALDAPPVQEFS